MLAALMWVGQEVEATPIYAIRSANACDTCHIEPLGWANPEESERFCTLDCNGCHVSSTGGGLRTPTGEYYGKEVLPMWGTRPGEFGNPRDYLPEGYPDKGRYRLFEGFSGWWAGSTRMEDIPKRLGDIDPKPKFSWGMDYRGAVYQPMTIKDSEGAEDELAVFPMQADIYLSGRPLPNLVLYSNAGLRGARDRENKPDNLADSVQEYLAVRELFVKVDRLPYNSYVRAGRFAPPYGWRIPDHTSFIRRDLGFDQNRQVFGLEGGYNPNYLFSNVAVFAQGLEGWPGDDGDEAIGAAAIAGWRDLGWHLFGNFQYLDRSDEASPDDLMLGVSWGLNLFPAVYLGELDYRMRNADSGDTNAVVAYHELSYLVTKGLSAQLKYDYQDPDLNVLDDHRDRYTLGLQFEPYTYTQTMLQYRLNMQAKELTNHEILFMFHVWL
jgi:hypothetical protein